MILNDDTIVKIPPPCEVGEINTQMRDRNYSIIMKLCGNTTDCKHDFGLGGPNSKDRSYMNNQDCNNTFIKEQLKSCVKIGALSKEIEEQDINTLYFQKILIRGSTETLLVEKQITSSANTIHEIFDFTSHLIKQQFVLNDRIMIRLIQRRSSETITIAQYCVCRPFYGEYQLMKRNSRFVKPYYVFDPEEHRRLKNDVETYGSNGIFCIRVGNRDSFIQYIKIYPDVINKINELFHFNEKHYTIDSTHIKKEIYEPLFGSNFPQYFLGDKLDPSTAKNGESIRKYSSCKNRFHFCFVRGKQIDIELVHNHAIGNFTIQFWSERSFSESISFESPDFTPPSVSDISSYIFENLLKGTSRIGELLSALNKIRKCFVNNKRVAPVVYHNKFFEFILQGVSSLLPPGPLTKEEMITILTSIKTKGDFIRLKDTENLTLVSEGNDAVCLTLDKFLFDLNVSLQKVWMLGDSPSTANFELIVYTRYSTEKIQGDINELINFVKDNITDEIKVKELKLDLTQENFGIDQSNYYEIKSKISNMIEQEREIQKIKDIFDSNENDIVIPNYTDEQIVPKMKEYISSIKSINDKIQELLPKPSGLEILRRRKTFNLRDVLINDESQETVIQNIKTIYYAYYVFIIQQFCKKYSEYSKHTFFHSSTLKRVTELRERVIELTEQGLDVTPISDIKALQHTLKTISIPPPPPPEEKTLLLLFNIFKDVKKEINDKSSFFSTATDVLYVKGCLTNHLKYSKIELPGSKLFDMMVQTGGSPDIHADDSIVDMFLYIIFSVYSHYIDEMEIIDFLDVLCDNIQNCQDESIDKTINILEKTRKKLNQDIIMKKVIRTLNVHIKFIASDVITIAPIFIVASRGKSIGASYRTTFDKHKNFHKDIRNLKYLLRRELRPDLRKYLNVTLGEKKKLRINRNNARNIGVNRIETGGNRTKKNRPKKCKKHGTRSKKLLKNKTRKHHSTRSKRKNKK
jgi:hypothetical protein